MTCRFRRSKLFCIFEMNPFFSLFRILKLYWTVQQSQPLQLNICQGNILPILNWWRNSSAWDEIKYVLTVHSDPGDIEWQQCIWRYFASFFSIIFVVSLLSELIIFGKYCGPNTCSYSFLLIQRRRYFLLQPPKATFTCLITVDKARWYIDNSSVSDELSLKTTFNLSYFVVQSHEFLTLHKEEKEHLTHKQPHLHSELRCLDLLSVRTLSRWQGAEWGLEENWASFMSGWQLLMLAFEETEMSSCSRYEDQISVKCRHP